MVPRPVLAEMLAWLLAWRSRLARRVAVPAAAAV
jgi:hypothetical protein